MRKVPKVEKMESNNLQILGLIDSELKGISATNIDPFDFAELICT